VNQTYWVYIMASASGTLYIGSTSELVQRTWEHKNGTFEGFSKKYGCNRLVYYESTYDPRDSANRERKLKGWTRAKKIALIESVNPHWEDLAKNWGRHLLMPNESMVEAERKLKNRVSLSLRPHAASSPGRKGTGDRNR
jgi:putative endonuclease